MDFLVLQNPQCADGEFEFRAISEAAKRFTAERMGSGVIGFFLDQHHFSSAVQDIVDEDLVLIMR